MDAAFVELQDLENEICRTVSDSEPHDLRWCSLHDAEIDHVRVFGDECVLVSLGITPNRGVIGFVETEIENVRRTWNLCSSAGTSLRDRFWSSRNFNRVRPTAGLPGQRQSSGMRERPHE